jgi:glycosyltransferase involved in cell wall biosynthesis
VHDVSFARDPRLMSRKDHAVFARVVPRAVRQAARVFTVSERTKADLVELYGAPAEKVVVTPNGVAPAFAPGPGAHDYVLAVGAIQRRKNQPAALEAAAEVGLPLVVAGPEKEPSVAEELRRGGARLEGYVTTERLAELYRGAACLVQSSRYEGFGLPVLEAMASGTPVVAVPDAALREVAGEAAVFAEESELGNGIRRALAERERLVAAGLERARAFTWRATAEKTLAVYREILGT